ncbi:MAG: hypothetical protein ACC662_05045, partial [Planctomycetota bacterium]
MQHVGRYISRHGLDEVGIRTADVVHWNLTTAALYELSIRRNESQFAHLGPLLDAGGTRILRIDDADFA